MERLPEFEPIYVHASCDEVVATAIRAFAKECESDSFTTASRRYPLWRLVREHIDPAVSDYARRTGGLHLFETERFSDVARRGIREAEDKIREQIRLDMEQPGFGSVSFQLTLDSLYEVLLFFRERGPKRSVGPSRPDKPQRGREARSQRRKASFGEVSGYCELCWRLTAASQARAKGLESEGVSRRFCKVHDPSEKTSRYRVDHKYRTAFHKKLREIVGERNTNRFYKEMTRCDNIIEELRRFAYEYVHVSANRIEAERMYRSGFSKAEIARRLGISRQAVHDMFKKELTYFEGRTASNLLTMSSARKCV